MIGLKFKGIWTDSGDSYIVSSFHYNSPLEIAIKIPCIPSAQPVTIKEITMINTIECHENNVPVIPIMYGHIIIANCSLKNLSIVSMHIARSTFLFLI